MNRQIAHDDVWTIINALRMATTTYQRDQKDAELTGNRRIAEQFKKQADACERVADQLEEEAGIYR